MKITNMKAQAKVALTVISKNSTRSYGSVVLVKFTNKSIQLVATNGFTLYESNAAPTINDDVGSETISVVAPIEVVKAIASGRLVSYSHGVFTWDDTGKNASGTKFPTYTQVLGGFLDSKNSDVCMIAGDRAKTIVAMGEVKITGKTEGLLLQSDLGIAIISGIQEKEA